MPLRFTGTARASTVAANITAAASPFNTYSISLDGVNDFMEANALASDYTADTTGSFSFWVKFVDATPTADEAIWSISDSSATNEWMVCRIRATTGYLQVLHRTNAAIQWNLNTDAVAFSDNTWHHVAIVQNGTTPVVYIDAVQVAQTITLNPDETAWFTDLASPNTFNAGRLRYGTVPTVSNYINGFIDEFAYFSNTALSSSQVTDIYNGGSPTDLSSYSPVGWWRMGDNDGGTGTTITDQGSGSNNATLTNGPTFSTDVPS